MKLSEKPELTMLPRCEMVNRTTLLFYYFTDRFNRQRILKRCSELCLMVYKNAFAGATLLSAIRR
jgi:hypothetical protein